MSITYLRDRAREIRHARTEAECEALLEELAYYFNIIASGERLTTEHRQKVLKRLWHLRVNASRKICPR
ncbi:hypothetical protein ACQ4M4_27220 [Leptolyngbya sp. AN02str]|uniref:hypothetical protein n=1 Tax=Leptolyngbya sp. AN02str TaxID=3423363 RepID=UPI003D31C084